jgi:hypothetical protein
MTTMVVTCRDCGKAFQPAHDAIIRSEWHTCPACCPTPAELHRCTECGRPLRLTSRTLCARYLGVKL